MNEGILLIDKPKQNTSFFLVRVLRKITNIQKIGHTGTLDPLATGVMVMLIGKTYTRQAEKMQKTDKTYEVLIELGKISDSYDADGTIETISTTIPSLKEIEENLLHFQGDVSQIPPMFSAKKIAGKRLYSYARRGINIERPPITVSLKTTLLDYSYPFIQLHIKCSSGTYIRSIAHDLGQMLGVGGFVKELRRIQSGDFSIDQCISFEALTSCNFQYQNHLIHSQNTIYCLNR